MPTHPLTPVAHQQGSSKSIAEKQKRDLLRLLDHLELTATEIQLLQLLAKASPHPVRDHEIAAAVTGNPDLDRQRRAVLEQQLARLRSKLMAYGIRLLCVERYGYLLLADSEA